MRTVAYAWLFSLTASAISSGAQACSVAASYRVPTTLQLVDRADSIVLARVVDGGPIPYLPAARLGVRSARFVPFATLKGPMPRDAFSFEFAGIENIRAGLKSTPSDPRNLVDPNPDEFKGSCNREVFKVGMIVVAFLKKDRGKLVPLMPPFSRTLEDVPSANALWVKTVREYVAIARKPKSMRAGEMRRRRDLLRFEPSDPDGLLIGLELDRALRAGKS